MKTCSSDRRTPGAPASGASLCPRSCYCSFTATGRWGHPWHARASVHMSPPCSWFCALCLEGAPGAGHGVAWQTPGGWSCRAGVRHTHAQRSLLRGSECGRGLAGPLAFPCMWVGLARACLCKCLAEGCWDRLTCVFLQSGPGLCPPRAAAAQVAECPRGHAAGAWHAHHHQVLSPPPSLWVGQPILSHPSPSPCGGAGLVGVLEHCSPPASVSLLTFPGTHSQPDIFQIRPPTPEMWLTKSLKHGLCLTLVPFAAGCPVYPDSLSAPVD